MYTSLSLYTYIYIYIYIHITQRLGRAKKEFRMNSYKLLCPRAVGSRSGCRTHFFFCGYGCSGYAQSTY